MFRRTVSLVMSATLITFIIMSIGCAQPDRITEPERPPLSVEPTEPGPEVTPDAPSLPPEIEEAEAPDEVEEADPRLSDTVVTDVREPLKGRYSDAEKQEIIQKSLINLMRVSVSSQEQLHLSDEKATSNVSVNDLTSRLAGLTFQVIDGIEDLPFDASETQQDQYRETNRCNLAFLIKGEARKVDKFGNFYSFGSEMEGKVLNLTTHQVLARKSVSRRGRRALNEREAAEDALRAGAKDLTTYLTDEVARLWEATSLVKMELEVDNLRNIAQADDIRNELQRRTGVYYVSMESWSAGDRRAVYEVLCRFDVQRFLASYVEELRDKGLAVERFEQHGEAIEARRRIGR